MIEGAQNSIFKTTILVFLIILLLSCQKPSATNNEKEVLQTNKENVAQLPAEAHTDDQTTQQPITITSPTDGSRLCMETIVRGTISNPNLQVFVLIHPMRTGIFWVQQVPERGNNWHIIGRFGEHQEGIGEYFEIIAVASKNKTLFKREQKLPAPLSDNPYILFRSNPVKVTRAQCLR